MLKDINQNIQRTFFEHGNVTVKAVNTVLMFQLANNKDCRYKYNRKDGLPSVERRKA